MKLILLLLGSSKQVKLSHHVWNAFIVTLRPVSVCLGTFLAIVGFVSVGYSPASAQNAVFDAPVGIGSPDFTQSLAVGDLNGDGALDLVVGNGAFTSNLDNTVALFPQQNVLYLNKNDGSGDLTLLSFLEETDVTNRVILGDLNGDGALDLISGNMGQNFIYLNNGLEDNIFQSAIPFGEEDSTHDLALGDFNSDGALDLVAVNFGEQNKIYLNKNDGSGTFVDTPILLSDTDFTTSVAAGDLNRDGFLDIFIGNGQFEPSRIYLNQGDGTGLFGEPILVEDASLNGNVISASLGDLNGDGALDLVVGNAQLTPGGIIFDKAQNAILINRDDGSGSFLGPKFFGSADTTGWVNLGDLNGDGFLDLVVVNNLNEGGDLIYFNDGTDAIFPQEFLRPIVGQDNTSSIEIGDINGDGAPDLILGNTGEQNLVRLNRGRAIFGPATNYLFPDLTQDIAVGDLNGDAFLDVIVGNGGTNIIYYSGAFPVALSEDVDTTYSIAVGDLNSDGALDIVVGNGVFVDEGGEIVNGQSNRIYLNKNDGTGAFLEPIFFEQSDNTNSLALGDINSDGALDLVVGNYTGLDENGQLIGQQNWIYLNKNDGSGTFFEPIELGLPDKTASLALGDIDGNGTLDIVVGNDREQNLLYLTQWDGSNLSFQIRVFETIDATNAVALGDLNDDGTLDLVIGNASQQNLIYLNRNDGSGSFALPTTFGDAIHTGALALGDLNGNGVLDIVLSNLGSTEIYKNRADGSGTFFEAIPLGIPSSEILNTSLALGDFGNDGNLDLIVGRVQTADVFNPSAAAPAQNLYYPNSGTLVKNLLNSIPAISVNRPGSTGDANFYSTSEILSEPVISIPFRLFDPEGDTIGQVSAFYSLDGGGNWQPAIPTTDTDTTNLSVGQLVEYADSNDPQLIPQDGSPLFATLPITDIYEIGNLEVWFTISHTHNAGLTASLISPQGTSGILFFPASASGQNFQGTRFATTAVTTILSGTAPYTGTYQPIFQNNFVGESTQGDWTLRLFDNSQVGSGTLIDWGLRITTPQMEHIFNWDTFASGVFGQSDNVVVRLLASPQPQNSSISLPGTYRYTNRISGFHRWPFDSATTFPFRVRGTQVQAQLDGVDGDNSQPDGALIYRLPNNETGLAQPMPSADRPLPTDSAGFLQGRGRLDIGDRLVALWPPPENAIDFTDRLSLFQTSSQPTENGLEFFTVETLGVQVLTVSDKHKLVLANLDVALEWDARKDTIFTEQLAFNLQRTSQLLYDWSDGQLALGKIKIYHDAKQAPEVDGWQPWLDSHIRIYASNRLRPSATQGGIVREILSDPDNEDLVYFPGWVNMGSVWSRYGDAGENLGEDWPRALAHELSHYLLFLDDNYLGLTDSNVLTTIPATQCPGAMNDPYSDVYSEFHPEANWQQSECVNTLSHQGTARADWETIEAFYPMLQAPSADTPTNLGPSTLPLAVTEVEFVASDSFSNTLDIPIFTLTKENGEVYQPSSGTRAILFQDERVTDLGSPRLDQVLAHGARIDDRVCVYDLGTAQVGCETITVSDDQLQMTLFIDWKPEVIVSPVHSHTLTISVTVASQLDLQARIFSVNGVASSVRDLDLASTSNEITSYSTTFTLTEPILEGYIHVWVDEPEPRREVISDFALGENPAFLRSRGAFLRSRGAFLRSRGAFLRSRGAPTTSSDGQVILFLDELQVTNDSEWYFTLQAATTIPEQPSWATTIGQGYWLVATEGTPDLSGMPISFSYLGSDVPAGEETYLRIYYWDGAVWQPLSTELDTFYNIASAQSQGPGLYVLMSSIEIPLSGPGWNNISYPVQASRPISEALAFIDGAYSVVAEYLPDAEADLWQMYSPNAPDWVNDLEVLQTNRGYWIYATEPITLLLKGADTDQVQAASNLTPPAVYYGVISPAEGFALSSGMSMTAFIDGQPCGQTQTQEQDEQVVYVIKVAADSADTDARCGAIGRNITFVIEDRPMTATTAEPITWDNRVISAADLMVQPPIGDDDPEFSVNIFLPLTIR